MPDTPPAADSEDLLQAVLLSAAKYQSRPALSGRHGRTLRYRDLAVAIVATAKGLHHNGFEPGNRLLFSVRPSPAAIVLLLATVAAGGTVVFDDPDSGADVFAARAAVTHPDWVAAESVLYAAGSFPLLRSLTRPLSIPDYAALGVRTLRAGPWLPGSGTISLRSLSRGRGPVGDEPLLSLRENPEAEAVVLFTAGTTGDSKAVVHTRRTLGAALPNVAARYEIDLRSTVYTDQLMLGLPALAAGAHWRLPPFGRALKTDPIRFAKNLGRATHTFMVPADLAPVLTAISEGLVSRPTALQHLLVGGAPVLPPLVARTLAVLPNVRLLAVYGMAEIMPIAVAEGTDKLLADPDGDPVGELLPGVRARVANDGELIVSGPNLAKGYLGEPPLTEQATGDLAILRGRSVVLRGRKKDMIIRGDQKIYPALYEPAIEALPGVGHAALVGVPNEIGDERVVLALQPAGQPVNDHPLAAEPKQSNSRDDDLPDAQQIRVLLQHPLASAVAAEVAKMIDAASLPDQIVVLSAIPTAGRGRATDRAALGRLLADVPLEDPYSPGDNDPARGPRRLFRKVPRPPLG